MGLAVVMMRQQRGRRAEVMQAVRSKPKPRRGLGAVNQSGGLREVVAGRRQRAKRRHGDAPAAPWHIRIHRINSPRSYRIIEGGFAVSRPDGGPGGATEEDAGIGSIVTATDFSGIRDLGSTVARTGRALKASPNSNLINANTTVPQLLGEIQSGETILFTAILALGNPNAGQAAWNRLPRVPQLLDLEEIIRIKGSEVSTMNLKRYRCNALEKH